jgi:hypothetical protein
VGERIHEIHTLAQVEGALRRGLKAIREEGRPAVISV